MNDRLWLAAARRDASVAICVTSLLLLLPRPVAAQDIDGNEVLTWALIGAGVGAVIGVIAAVAGSSNKKEHAPEPEHTSSWGAPATASAARDPELLSASAQLNGITVTWSARPRRDPRSVQLSFQRYARSATPGDCKELELALDGQISRYALHYQAHSQGAIVQETFAARLDVDVVRAMQAAPRAGFRFCGVDRALTPSAADRAKQFLTKFDALAAGAKPAPNAPATATDLEQTDGSAAFSVADRTALRRYFWSQARAHTAMTDPGCLANQSRNAGQPASARPGSDGGYR